MTALLRVESLSTRLPSPRGLVHAVDRVSFAVAPGETLGIVGESGSGKSVLARTIMSLTPATALVSGEVRFDGDDLLALSRKRMRLRLGVDLAMVFQDPATALNPVMRVGRQLVETLEVHLGLNRPAAIGRAVDLLRDVGIPDPAARMHCYPHELSGGMRQRVCIAIAVACAPRLLFADEPTTALDGTIQRQILDLLHSLRKANGMSVVLISHDLGVMAQHTDRTMVMYGGRVVEAGPTVELFREPRHPYTVGLLGSIPRLEQPSHTRLTPLPGQPVDVVDPRPGCRFAARCLRARDACHREDPVPTELAPGHEVACFFPIETGPIGTGPVDSLVKAEVSP